MGIRITADVLDITQRLVDGSSTLAVRKAPERPQAPAPALKLKLKLTKPVTPPPHPPPPLVRVSNPRLDPELGRLFVALNLTQAGMMWAVLRRYARDNQGQKYMSRAAFYELLKLHAPLSKPAFDGFIRQGDGLFWDVSHDGIIRLIGYLRVAETLVQAAVDMGRSELVYSNYPGQLRDMYVPVSFDNGFSKAYLYKAWLVARGGALTIARSTLSALFGHGDDALRHWEQSASIEAKTNRAFYGWQNVQYVPQHGYYKQGLWRAQVSNTYLASQIGQHNRRGQGRKVSATVSERVESAGEPCGQDGSNAVGGMKMPRLYFEDVKRAERSAKYSDHLRPRYVRAKWLSKRYCQWYEFTLDGKSLLDRTFGIGGKVFLWIPANREHSSSASPILEFPRNKRRTVVEAVAKEILR